MPCNLNQPIREISIMCILELNSQGKEEVNHLNLMVRDHKVNFCLWLLKAMKDLWRGILEMTMTWGNLLNLSLKGTFTNMKENSMWTLHQEAMEFKEMTKLEEWMVKQWTQKEQRTATLSISNLVLVNLIKVKDSLIPTDLERTDRGMTKVATQELEAWMVAATEKAMGTTTVAATKMPTMERVTTMPRDTISPMETEWSLMLWEMQMIQEKRMSTLRINLHCLRHLESPHQSSLMLS